MRTFLLAVLFILLYGSASAQPMSGPYTVGGSAPDFQTLQEAADSLKSRGISGPVSINIRPGTYIKSGGLDAVMILDGLNTGVSPVNRITIQPDEAAHGSVDNVILQMDQTAQTSASVVKVQVDHTTIRNLTFEDIDSGEAGANQLLHFTRTQSSTSNPTLEGVIVEGCRFIGNPSSVGGTTFGTDFGIMADNTVTDIIVRHCTFRRLMRSVNIGTTGTGSGTKSALVEDNAVVAAHFGISTTGSFIGHGILAHARNGVIRRNHLDNTDGLGSFTGIILAADTGLVERNRIQKVGAAGAIAACTGIDVAALAGAANGPMIVANNMISGGRSGRRTGILARRRAEILHNTVVHPERTQISRGIVFDLGNANGSRVLNNIVLDYAGYVTGTVNAIVLFDQTDGLSGLVSDYNVFFVKDPDGVLVKRGSTVYKSLAEYRDASGLDSHSIIKSVDFLGGLDDPHLSECEGQDAELVGIPVPEVADDLDGDIRSVTAPFRGADEGKIRLNPMFGEVFRIGLSGTPMSLASGEIDGQPGDDLAVCDYDNSEVQIFVNNASGRSFSKTASLSVPFKPTVVSVLDLDEDGNQDVIAAGETTLVDVHWGDGLGGFPDETYVSTSGRVVSIEPFGSKRIIVTEDAGFLERKGYLGFINYTSDSLVPGLRLLCHSVLLRDEGLLTVTDTVPASLYDIAVGDFDSEPGSEAVAIGLGLSGPRIISFKTFVYRVAIGGGVCGDRFSANYDAHPYNIGSFVGHASGVVPADFDGDGDADFVMTGSVSTLLSLLRNDGSFALTEALLPALPALGIAALDFDGDGDADIVTANRQLEDKGVSVLLNDGAGSFTQELNCYARLGSGVPFGVIAADFDQDGRTDVAIASSFDSVFVLYNAGRTSTSVREEGAGRAPQAYRLEQNYPNPFNPQTVIRYQLPHRVHVELVVMDVLGRDIATLVDDEQEAGTHAATWNAVGQASGVYFYRLTVGSHSETRKLMLVR